MPSWTVVTARPQEARDYEHTQSDSTDSWDATADVVATMDADDRVRKWTEADCHVYAYLAGHPADFDVAERVLADYGELLQDAVVLRANDTTDTGAARYYPKPGAGVWTDHYAEDQATDGTPTGRVALATMTTRHGILARDPFHERVGRIDEQYLEDGIDRLDDAGAPAVRTDGGCPTHAYSYNDLEWEAIQLVERGAERIDEKDDERPPAGWRGHPLEDLFDGADRHLDSMGTAAFVDDNLEAARTEAADVVNYILMVLANLPAANGGEDRGE